ncbi:M20 family metallopeptidase [Puniceibacterium sp. IMCC21224]|uniref:M20 family metallopeptidase n=1 Tax=Puniceibacterium sp. IMCC21224 TaxID=1618204 RepID=UPI00064DB3CE|nr:M20 family metallopeptidase [Puniceibacterium sp. IMCC21224]KMK68500.1 acetylornithine deacetylase/succinyldiaminopimelate desuccinylase-like deacylase [Puniceibacterium sp. IMCC21224]
MFDDLPAPDVQSMMAALSRLVACATPMPPGDGYGAFADLIETQFATFGGTATRVEVPTDLWHGPGLSGARINLLLTPDLPGTKGLPEALIYFHTDTAPAGDGWSVPPFTVTNRNGKLLGRGTADMKGTIVAVHDALTRLSHSGAGNMVYRPVLAFCTDEEGGRYPGIRHLAETTRLPDVLLNLNGSAEPRIWAGCVGSYDITVTITGLASHSGEPQRGVNAAEIALPVMLSLQDLKYEVELRETALPAPPWVDGPLRARLNITAIHAGDKGSAIPGACQFTINRRYTAEEDEAAVLQEIRATIAAQLDTSAALDWQMQVTGHLPPVSDPDGSATGRWTRARARAFDLPESAFTRYGSGTSSDFGWVQKAGLRHMLLGGLSRPDRNVHAADEFTTVQDLCELSDAIAYFLADIP